MAGWSLLRLAAAVAAVTGAASAAAPPGGDWLSGRALFIGARPLANGGPPCGACHAIGGASAPFAAALGPELSKTFDEPEATDAILQALPFPSMAPLYEGRPLTPSERADLTAFFLQVAGKPPPGGAAVAGWAALVAAVLLAGMGMAARRRKGSTRAELLARPPLTSRPRPPAPAAPAASPPAPGGSR